MRRRAVGEATVAPPARVGGGARGAMGAGRSLTFAMALLAEGRAPARRAALWRGRGAPRNADALSPGQHPDEEKTTKTKNKKTKTKNKNKGARHQSKEIDHTRTRAPAREPPAKPILKNKNRN